ncbi:MAG: hypothetical protein Q4F67_00405, partial [Propionibacteriaceae bacterium]|nr:hypothetical protein [Propionibacteriaceae bacterium]
TTGPGGHERWVRSQDGVIADTVRSEENPGRKLGQRPTWRVAATLRPEAQLSDLAAIVAAWPARADGSTLVLTRTGGPRLSFTAQPHAERNTARWETFEHLHRTWPTAGLTLARDAVVELDRCDPWDELDQIDAAEALGRPHAPSLTLSCRIPVATSVSLPPSNLQGTGELAGLRDRSRAVLSQLPGTAPWAVTVERPTRPLLIEVTTPDIPEAPSRAVLAEQRAELRIKQAEPAGRVTVLVTAESDLRPAARAVAALPWLDRIDINPGLGWVELRGDLGRIDELIPLAEQHPEINWWLAESGEGPVNWVRAPGGEFGERARHYHALVDSGIEWTSIVLHHNAGRPTLSVEVADPGDWRPVVEAVRSVRWRGDLSVEIGTHYPGVAFTSTATGPARDAQVANNLVPPNPERHPELIEILKAWDATAT